jgi:hypothetical protein
MYVYKRGVIIPKIRPITDLRNTNKFLNCVIRKRTAAYNVIIVYKNLVWFIY